MQLFFSQHFKNQLKRLKQKYPNISQDLLDTIEDFDYKNETSIGRSIYKIRIPCSDMKRGKAGGFRAYMYLYLRRGLLCPLCIYPKSETESITENELEHHFHRTMQEIIEQF